MHLIEWGDRRILLDCGKDREQRLRSASPTDVFPFNPASVSAVVLSHAHVDHCGNLPHLVRGGFDGPIYCTPPTRDLLGVVLRDSARIQEEDARVEALTRGPDRPPREARFTAENVDSVLSQCVPLPYGQPEEIAPDVELRFSEAGHVLGSAVSTLTLDGFRRHKRITFTGDLGRRGLPYLLEAAPVPESDLIISECTYAGRRHHTMQQMADRLSEVVHRTAERNGKVLIPAFSLGRTQVVVHYLRTWMREGLLPWLPIYVDSKQAHAFSKVHDRYPELFQVLPTPSDPPVHYVRSREEGQELSLQGGPAIIVASGGMCDGGRIMDHLRFHVDDPRSTILLVSYQAPGSLGSQLLELRPTVRFHGRTWNKWADVVELNGFSGHADQDDLMAYLAPLASTGCKVRLVHGEVERGTHLVRTLLERGFDDVAIPARSDTVSLN